VTAHCWPPRAARIGAQTGPPRFSQNAFSRTGTHCTSNFFLTAPDGAQPGHDSTSVRVLLLDDTEITHSLPSASQRVIRELA
jgi:hypothetical protein